MTSDSSLITFKAISNFTECLDEVFGKTQRSLKLYSHLLQKTTLSHVKPIQKHITCFTEFCVKNRDCILEKNTNLNVDLIKYSDRVYINMKKIFKEADTETKEIIWKHLLTISAIVDPAGKAKKLLEESAKSGGNEANFLNDIIGKVEKHVKPGETSNPMEAVSSIMSSGIFTELLGGMGNGLQNGSLNLGKLMGTVQNMVGSLSSQMNQSENSENMPDLNGMLGMLTPMLNQMNPQKEEETKVEINEVAEK